MSLARFKAQQLLDQPAVINQFLLILVQKHRTFQTSAWDIPQHQRQYTSHRSSVHVSRNSLPWSPRLIRSSNTILSTISRSQHHNEALQSSLTFSVSALLYIRWNKQTLMWQLHTMASFSSSHAVWNACAKRSYANEPRRNEHKGPLLLCVYY